MPPSENLGNIRLTLDNIYDDMYKEQQHIPRIQEEGWRLNLWQLWKVRRLAPPTNLNWPLFFIPDTFMVITRSLLDLFWRFKNPNR